MSDKEHEKSVEKIYYIIYSFCFIVALIVMRLAYLQIEKNDELERLGKKNYTVTEMLPALRGNFVDCNGYLLVSCRPVTDLYWIGSGNRFLTDRQKKLTALLDSIFTVDKEALLRAERQKRKILLGSDVSLGKICQLYEAFPEPENLAIEHRFKRIYPYGSLASHTIGYLNRLDIEGRAGLEGYFEQQLQGKKGYVTHIKNAVGRSLLCQERQAAQAGKTLQLTLDVRLQMQAEQLFSNDHAGVLLVMDPEDGSLRVSVSHPGFDPNKFLDPLSSAAWQETMSNRNAFLNRVSHAGYPPASIFKLVTLTAGCEEGIVHYDTAIDCKGFVEFCGRKYYCMRRWGHGLLSIKQALARSCNVHCYEIAQKIDIDTLAAYADRFGLGRKTDFLLGEIEGLMPTSLWKKRVKKESWWRGETISASIGQSYITITPLQAARMIGGIYKGYLVKPRILTDELVEREALAISPETLLFLRESMKEAVRSGTVKVLNNLKNFVIHAKTGTAQTCSLDRTNNKERTREQIEHAWFSGWFKYKDHQPLVIIVFLEHVGSSRDALAMARKFFEAYQTLYEQQAARNAQRKKMQ